MRKILLALLFSLPVFGVEVIQVAPTAAPVTFEVTGPMVGSLVPDNYGTCALAARSTAGVGEADSYIIIYSNEPNEALYVGSDTATQSANGAATLSWEAVDDNGAIQDSADIDIGAGNDLLIRVNLSSGASSLAGTDTRPTMHLASADSWGTSSFIRITVRGSLDVESAPRGTLEVCQKNSTIAALGGFCGARSSLTGKPKVREIKGHGSFEAIIPIRIDGSGTELECIDSNL